MKNLQITKTVKLKEVQVLPLGDSEALQEKVSLYAFKKCWNSLNLNKFC